MKKKKKRRKWKMRLKIAFPLCRTRRNKYVLQYVPPILRTEDLCLLALENSHDDFDDLMNALPEMYRSNSFFISAVQVAGDFLGSIPYEKRNERVCKRAVNKYGYAIQWVPQQFITPELCRAAVLAAGCALRYVPVLFITRELCKLAVESDPFALEFVPAGLQTREMCLAALKSNKPRKKELHRGTFTLAEELETDIICFVAPQYKTPELLALAGKGDK
jgi:hypothetical protein